MTSITSTSNNSVTQSSSTNQSNNVEQRKGKSKFTSMKVNQYFDTDSSSCDVDSSEVEESTAESLRKEKETNEQSSGIEESDVGDLMKNLRNAGYVPKSDDIARKTKEAIDKYVIPFSKFVDQSNLPQDGIIAKVLKNQLKAFKSLDINGDSWEMYWANLSQMVKVQCRSFKSAKTQQIGRSVIGKKRIMSKLFHSHLKSLTYYSCHVTENENKLNIEGK